MRIDTNNMAGIGASGLDRTQSADAVEQQAGQAVAKRGAGGAADQVNLSVLAERLQAMEPQSPERQARLEQLAAAYQAGTYNPDPAAVSEAMIDDATMASGESTGSVGPG
ncbi:flagellar biosynthesis anti-sigma factor FlgM [Paludibaculum fermentans]|uniref:flagellar biosynthesis anti-sigma factor FlgM n=1 Tax=Paludibaculum fermentans TaxID=1473598 RepID=UPI003EBE78F7